MAMLLPWSRGIAGQGADILLIKSGDSALYSQVDEAFRQQLARQCKASPCPSVRSVTRQQVRLPGQEAPRLIVALGHKASLDASRAAKDIPQLHCMVSKPEHATHEADSSKVSAIYLEQPLRRQLAFARFILPQHRRLGVLLGKQSTIPRELLLTRAKQWGFELHVKEIESPKQIGKQLHALKGKIDVLLALPDRSIYNRNTLATILLTTYRDRIPVIGFSAGVVKAGAIGGIYSSPKTIGREAAARALELMQGKPPGASYPSLQEAAVNRRVAAALHIRLPTNREIQRWQEDL